MVAHLIIFEIGSKLDKMLLPHSIMGFHFKIPNLDFISIIFCRVIVRQETKHEDCVHCMLFVLRIIK